MNQIIDRLGRATRRRGPVKTADICTINETVDAPHSGPSVESVSASVAAIGTAAARTFTLRILLTLMALAVMLPMGIVGAVAIQQVVTEYQQAYQERLRATARLLGIALDAEIEVRRTAIMALASSPLMDQPPSQELYEYASQIGSALGTWVAVNRHGTQVLNTRFPFGAPLPPRNYPWNESLASHFHVSNIRVGHGLARPYVTAVGPVIRSGEVVATIGIPFSTEQLARRLAEGLFTSDGVLCLLDREGIVIARTRRADDFVGKRVGSWLLAAAATPGQTISRGSLLDGGSVIVATAHPSQAPDWTVVVAQPIAGYYQEWIRPLMVLGGGGLVLLLALLLLVDRFALWLVKPLKALTQDAKFVARGRRERLPEASFTSRVAEFETLRVALNEAAHVMDGRAEAIRVAFASARRERNLLHSVVDGTSDPTVVRDTSGRVVLANAAALTVFGLPATKVVGEAIYTPGLARTDEECRAEDRKVIAAGAPIMIERTMLVDGQMRSFLGTKSPWRSALGDLLGVVVIIHDITEWKRSENRLREIQAELIRTGRLSAMGAMASGLAHELNQPLAAITNYLGAARRLLASRPATPPHRAASGPAAPVDMRQGVASGAIDDACTQAIRAGEIVSRLRDFIGRGVGAMRIETIGDMIADACALALPQDTRARVALRVQIDAELSPVFADRLQIQQVLVNLVLNAVQSMAEAEQAVLSITARRSAVGDTCIDVADTGTGIPEAMLSAVFEPFITTRTDGLGMGLAIARMIVSAHGGTLSARNNDDGGATVAVVLPAVLSMEGADV